MSSYFWAGPLLAALLLAPPAARAEDQAKDETQDRKEKKDKGEENKSGQKGPSEPKDLDREIARLLRDLQFALEGGAARGVLSLIDAAKFDDYHRFEDMVERLMRQNSVRAYFRQVSISWLSGEAKARSLVDAELELARKDAAGQVARRQRQLALEFERTRRGWRITHLTPRAFFEPF